jgi:TolA-binding protein
MKTIKMYWKWIVAGIIALFGILAITQSKRNNKKLEKNAKQIDNNNQKIDIIQGKTELVEDQRVTVNQSIAKKQAKIDKLKTEKETIIIGPVAIEDAKENIIKKTRRGRTSKL